MPQVSVVMATRNNAQDIPLAVASVLAQDYSDFELVVVNDASTDATPAILQDFAIRDRRVVLLHNKSNLGRARSRNRAIESAQGNLVAILDADDLMMPHRLSRQAAYMQVHPEIAILGSWAIAVDVNNQPLGPLFKPTSDADIQRSLRRLIMPFVHSTVIFRREAAVSTGMYDPRFRASEDFHLCYRLARQAGTASLPEFLTLYRVHGTEDPRLVKARYRWACYASWDLVKQYPNPAEVLFLLRSILMAFLPVPISRRLPGIYKHRWDRGLLSEAQLGEVQHWLKRLSDQLCQNITTATN